MYEQDQAPRTICKDTKLNQCCILDMPRSLAWSASEGNETGCLAWLSLHAVWAEEHGFSLVLVILTKWASHQIGVNPRGICLYLFQTSLSFGLEERAEMKRRRWCHVGETTILKVPTNVFLLTCLWLCSTLGCQWCSAVPLCLPLHPARLIAE